MSILAGLLRNTLIPIALSAQVKAFFLLLQRRKIAKAKKQAFFKLNNCQKNSKLLRRVTELYNFE